MKTRLASRRSEEVIAAVRPLATDLAASSGLHLWDIGFVREAGRDTLRVAVDRLGGVNAEDLAAFSEALSGEIDQIDPVPGEQLYVLEVTSPGAERKLTEPDHFRICVGRVARITLTDGRVLEGPISEVTDHAVEIDSVRALFDDIKRAQLVVKL